MSPKRVAPTAFPPPPPGPLQSPPRCLRFPPPAAPPRPSAPERPSKTSISPRGPPAAPTHAQGAPLRRSGRRLNVAAPEAGRTKAAGAGALCRPQGALTRAALPPPPRGNRCLTRPSRKPSPTRPRGGAWGAVTGLDAPQPAFGRAAAGPGPGRRPPVPAPRAHAGEAQPRAVRRRRDRSGGKPLTHLRPLRLGRPRRYPSSVAPSKPRPRRLAPFAPTRRRYTPSCWRESRELRRLRVPRPWEICLATPVATDHSPIDWLICAPVNRTSLPWLRAGSWLLRTPAGT